MIGTPSVGIPPLEPLTPAVLRSLQPRPVGPSVSVYLPTRRASPPDELNRIVLKGLVGTADAALRPRSGAAERERLLAPFQELMESPILRAPAHDGLAAFAADGSLRLVALDGPVEPHVVVDHRFHVLPLVRRLAAVEHCLVIAITERVVRAFLGRVSDPGEDRVAPLPLPRGRRAARGEVVREDVVDQEHSEPHRVLHGGGPFGGSRVHGGFGGRSDGIDVDTGHFLRAAARLVAEVAGGDATRPLVTVALPRLATLFASLADDVPGERVRIDRDPSRLTDDELATAAGDSLRAGRWRRRERLVDDFRAARAHGRGSGDLAEIARAAVAGRVATLLLDADRREPGGIDRTTGKLLPAEPFAVAATVRPDGGSHGALGPDLYEDLVEIVVGHDGAIVPLDRLEMPTESGVAAIYRYAEP